MIRLLIAAGGLLVAGAAAFWPKDEDAASAVDQVPVPPADPSGEESNAIPEDVRPESSARAAADPADPGEPAPAPGGGQLGSDDAVSVPTPATVSPKRRDNQCARCGRFRMRGQELCRVCAGKAA